MPGIKWVNDVLQDGKKLCGILTELSVEGETGMAESLIIGAGVNVSQEPEDFGPEVAYIATSLAAEGYPVSLAALAAAKDRAVYGYTPEEATILKKLYADLASIQDEVGDDTPLVITMSTQVAALFDMNTTLARSVSPTDFRQGDITLKVKSLNGQHPIIRVGSGRLKTSYQFNDGTTENQVKGGFTPADDAQDINWIICPRSAPIAVSRTDKVRIFDPETYQKKRAWAVDYRKYHDLWVLDNKMNTILVNIKQPKAGA